MAKGSNKVSPHEPKALPRSVLSAAFELFESGDVLESRRLARAALSGKVGPDDERAAKVLAKELSTAGEIIGPTVPEVAAAMLLRSRPVGKAYWFAGLSLAILTGLVLLAALRYSH